MSADMTLRSRVPGLSIVLVAALAVPAFGASGDVDGDGYVGRVDIAAFAECFGGPNLPVSPQCAATFDFDEDGDVDMDDGAAFARALAHLPIPLLDTFGSVLTAADTTPYSGRQTCTGSCHAHDLDDPAGIMNGLKFQQGRTDTAGNVIMQDDHFGDGAWWMRSPGRFGIWSQATTLQMAGKENARESDFDQSAFAWIRDCSSCHPGGGPGEFDRDGELYYNEVTGEFGYEVLGETAGDVLLDGDYADFDYSTKSVVPARWDLSGVSGPDCLFCHRRAPTNMYYRQASLGGADGIVDSMGDPVPGFAAAATASQGWISDIEIVQTGFAPRATMMQIDYSVGVGDGVLIEETGGVLHINGAHLGSPATDRACWNCHVQKETIDGMVWFDDTPDVHYRKFNNLTDDDPYNDISGDNSTACNYCHPGGLAHNPAKGNSFQFKWRDELDWVNLRDCRDCHMWDSPNRDPDAPEVGGGTDTTTVHLTGTMMDTLSCQACHIPHSLSWGFAFMETTAGGVLWDSMGSVGITFQYYSADPLDPTNPDRTRWYPALLPKTDSDGVDRLFPCIAWLNIHWADWDQNGTPEDLSDDLLTPIINWRLHDLIGDAPLPVATDDNLDTIVEVNRPEEILAYIDVLKGNDSYGEQVAARPVLVKGPTVWYEDPEAPDGVSTFELEASGAPTEWWYYLWTLDHNVLPKENAWGAGEDCQVCHRTDGQSPVFDRLVLIDPYGVDGLPVYETVREMTGMDTVSHHDNIVLKDALGNPLTVDSTVPYSDRQTCGECHDIERIANGFIHQQGRTDAAGDITMQDDFYGDGRWWVRGDGMYGRWSGGGGGLNRQTAGKDNTSESAMDMTAFYWAANCGGCHAGGGGLEFDRDGERLWDEASGLFGYEVLGQTSGEVVLDGDYAFIDDSDGSLRPAPWDVTGVADPECLHCHRANRTYVDLQDMHREWRGAVLGTLDTLVDDLGDPVPAFAAAGTAGQGWFSTLDTGADPPVLQIDYAVGVAEGSLTIGPDDELVLTADFLAEPPRDESCWGCHLPGGFQGKRGTVWFDERDVHYKKLTNRHDEDPGNDIPDDEATACNTCHPGNRDHNFAKGDSPYAQFRNELDWQLGFRSCRECHLWDSPVRDPDAPEVGGGADQTMVHMMVTEEGNGPLRAMSCQACHVPYPLEKANIVTDRSLTGTAVTYLTDELLSANPMDPSDPDKSKWYPAMVSKIDSDGLDRLFPQKMEVAIYWADWDRNGTPKDFADDTVQPIILWRVRQITGNQALPIVTDDTGDGRLEVNRPEEILAYIQALKGNDSYGRQVAENPVLIKGRSMWYEAPPGSVQSVDYQALGLAVYGYEIFGLDHNVLVATEAWGAADTPAQGCDQCHLGPGEQSPVFDRLILIDPFDASGNAVYETVRNMTGVNPPGGD